QLGWLLHFQHWQCQTVQQLRSVVRDSVRHFGGVSGKFGPGPQSFSGPPCLRKGGWTNGKFPVVSQEGGLGEVGQVKLLPLQACCATGWIEPSTNGRRRRSRWNRVPS